MLRKAGTSPLFGRGAALVSMAVAIALGATSMSDIAVPAHLAPVLGAVPSGPTIRRTLDLAGGAVMLEQIARARARARAHVWQLIESIPAGFPWLVIAGKVLTGSAPTGRPLVSPGLEAMCRASHPSSNFCSSASPHLAPYWTPETIKELQIRYPGLDTRPRQPKPQQPTPQDG